MATVTRYRVYSPPSEFDSGVTVNFYPAHAAFGGYKISGVGQESHRMMLEHYSQTNCLFVSYDEKPLGLF